mmetsp:Transcript_12712/g.37411  ORF Transcript_12712/g.37411 Transcript_12712/m.37411 type:complete len:225 (+) Transcript_12712:155-829(+)|eukprot:CAMPEP_0113551668 /NCGR_PEP_ID=MMETSP0015_2-20120614/14647_1 /TAXON_ID=2838 /ORGANISM="Odontella" /LENGTH=224 /DNA_ID=CAMNT_0000452575 /DNA_START=153 /DNA_END=827 /DNA_ORIENTATION=- /assembly_acc=CAM_ASM_000160
MASPGGSGGGGDGKEPSAASAVPSYPTTSHEFVPRYNGPPESKMTNEQRAIRDEIVATRPRTGISGPFGPWLAVPEVARPSQELGRACRYGTSLTMRESELIILLTGARHRSHAEFDIHQGEALRAGLGMDVISAIPRDEEFSLDRVKSDVLPLLGGNTRDEAISLFTAELLETCTVSDETYENTLEAVDGKEAVLVEITSIVGYYTHCAYTLNVFRIPTKNPV